MCMCVCVCVCACACVCGHGMLWDTFTRLTLDAWLSNHHLILSNRPFLLKETEIRGSLETLRNQQHRTQYSLDPLPSRLEHAYIHRNTLYSRVYIPRLSLTRGEDKCVDDENALYWYKFYRTARQGCCPTLVQKVNYFSQ